MGEVMELTEIIELGNQGLFIRETWVDKPNDTIWACWLTIGFIVGMAFLPVLMCSPVGRLSP